MDADNLKKTFWEGWASYADSQQLSCIAVQNKTYPGKEFRFLYKKGLFGIEGNFSTKKQTVNVQFFCNGIVGEKKFQYLQRKKESLEEKIPGIQFKQSVRRVVKTLTYPHINGWIETMGTENLRLVNKEILATIIQFYDIFFIEYGCLQ